MRIRVGLGVSLITLIAIAALVMLTQPVAMQFFSTTMGHWTLGGISLLSVVLEAVILLPVCKKNSPSPSTRASLLGQAKSETVASSTVSKFDESQPQYVDLKTIHEIMPVIMMQITKNIQAISGQDLALLREEVKALKGWSERSASLADQFLKSIHLAEGAH